MTKKFNYNDFIVRMSGWGHDLDEDMCAEEAAYEAARGIVDDTPDVKKYLKSIGVTDFVGRVADDMHGVAYKEYK